MTENQVKEFFDTQSMDKSERMRLDFWLDSRKKKFAFFANNKFDIEKCLYFGILKEYTVWDNHRIQHSSFQVK